VFSPISINGQRRRLDPLRRFLVDFTQWRQAFKGQGVSTQGVSTFRG